MKIIRVHVAVLQPLLMYETLLVYETYSCMKVSRVWTPLWKVFADAYILQLLTRNICNAATTVVIPVKVLYFFII